MSKVFEQEVYQTIVNNKTFCFRYPAPRFSDDGKFASEVATVWEKGSDEKFIVPFYVRADEIDLVHKKIKEGIEKHLAE